MCNSQYMPIQKIKKGKINIKDLVRIHKLNASFFAFADGNNLPCTELLHIPLVSPPEYQMPYTGHMLAQDSPLWSTRNASMWRWVCLHHLLGAYRPLSLLACVWRRSSKWDLQMLPLNYIALTNSLEEDHLPACDGYFWSSLGKPPLQISNFTFLFQQLLHIFEEYQWMWWDSMLWCSSQRDITDVNKI